MQLYYNVANHVAYRSYINGYHHKDKVQECVIKAWIALGEHPHKAMIPLIYEIMKNHMIDLSKPFYNERKTTDYDWDEATILVPPKSKIVIPLPASQEERILVVAWLEFDGNLPLACESVGLNFWTGNRVWRRAKEMIKERGYDACLLDSDQLWLGGWR